MNAANQVTLRASWWPCGGKRWHCWCPKATPCQWCITCASKCTRHWKFLIMYWSTKFNDSTKLRVLIGRHIIISRWEIKWGFTVSWGVSTDGGWNWELKMGRRNGGSKSRRRKRRDGAWEIVHLGKNVELSMSDTSESVHWCKAVKLLLNCGLSELSQANFFTNWSAQFGMERVQPNTEKTGARGKGGACDAWTEQVHEPHLNNTHTHTLKKP